MDKIETVKSFWKDLINQNDGLPPDWRIKMNIGKPIK